MICGSMTGTAVVLQGGPNPLGLPAIPGITTLDGLKNALTQINGGAETVVPTNQASLLRSVQAGAIGNRLSVLHTRMMGGVASSDPSWATELAANDAASGQDTSPRIQLAQNTSTPTDAEFWSGKLGAFINVIGQFGDSDPTSNQNGYSFNNEGFLTGVDYQFMPNLVAGLAFGYTYSDTEFDSSPQSAPGQYLHGNLFQGNLYASWYPTDAIYLDGVASVGGGSTDSSRTIAIPGLIPGFTSATATGSFSNMTYGLSMGGGYNFPMGSWTLTPTARVEYHRVEAGGYAETGASGLDLTYGASAENAVLSFLGGQVQDAISTSFGVISPSARFNWAHQYNNGNTNVSIAYTNDPSLLSTVALAGSAPSRNYYDLGVGLAMQLAGPFSGFLNYDAILGLSHTSFNSFTAGLRYAF